mmetsp:Transcript_25977/g.53147  ORF Transcript_25977/g.53147 Transcript_25977/m.53147 type:complete len:89 (+) Transcript_25977:464-730(+)
MQTRSDRSDHLVVNQSLPTTEQQAGIPLTSPGRGGKQKQEIPKGFQCCVSKGEVCPTLQSFSPRHKLSLSCGGHLFYSVSISKDNNVS